MDLKSLGLFQHVKQKLKREKYMNKIIQKTFNVNNPPLLTKKQKIRLNKLATMTDNEIDCLIYQN